MRPITPTSPANSSHEGRPCPFFSSVSSPLTCSPPLPLPPTTIPPQLSPLNYLPLQPPATAGKFRKWLWRTSNKKFLGIFVRHWIQISSLLVIYYVLLSLVYWGFLHAATEVRQNQWLSITNQSFFSPDGDFQMYLAQVRIISPIIL